MAGKPKTLTEDLSTLETDLIHELSNLQQHARRAANREILAQAEKQIKRGDKTKLLFSLNYCLANQLPIPTWLSKAFCSAYDAARRDISLRSWNQSFGAPRRRYEHTRSKLRDKELAPRLFLEVEARRHLGEPLGEGLFEAVGQKFAISRSHANKLYYDFKRTALYYLSATRDGIQLFVPKSGL